MAIDKWGNWDGQPETGFVNLQGGSTSLQGSAPSLQTTSNPQPAGGGNLQVTANPMNYSSIGGGGTTLGATTGVESAVDPAAAAAAAKAAADAARAGQLRGEITNLVNSVKDIFNQRYGQVDAAAGEQTGKLNERFGTESGDITQQVEGENQKIGAAHASGGSFDSSYRGNNVDTVSRAGENQIRDLGTELQENMSKIAAWVTQQKTGFDANKQGMDQILGRLAETTDLGELTSLRSQLDGRITELRAGAADNNTMAQNAASLEGIAPTSSRAVQLKTTLSQILAGNADKSQKAAIGQKLISSAGLTPEEQQALLTGFQGSLAATDEQQQQTV